MGGAVTALEDDLGAISFNPATFNLAEKNSPLFFSFHINPVLPVIANRQEKYFGLDEKDGFDRAINNIQYLFKAITFKVNALSIGVLLNEEKYIKKSSNQFFDSAGFQDNRFHSAVVNIRLSSQVNIGISGSIIKSAENNTAEKGGEVSYGILVKPNNKYQIGIMFIDFANRVRNFRKRFDRLADESLNAGLAFFPWNGISFTLDVRNLTEDRSAETFGLQEFHAGFEAAGLKHISVRGGFYREKQENSKYSNVYSAGIGLIDMNRLRSVNTRYYHPDLLLSYTILLQDISGKLSKWHFLTMSFRI